MENDITIIYEDDDIVAVNKPAGLIVHADGKTSESTLVDWIRKRYPEIESVGEPAHLSDGSIVARPGIVHRLDRDTSGVLLIAKNQETFLFLKDQFQARQIKKMYLALVYGPLKEKKGVIDAPIGKSSKDFRKWSAERGARGMLREATTEYKVLAKTKDFSYVQLFPKTGRTHQIRVHLKSIGHPVVGDKLYAPKRPCPEGLNRMALHASQITFQSRTGAGITVEVPLPEVLQKALAMLGLL